MRFIAILFLALSLAACATNLRPPSIKGLEASRSLGHGFWQLVVTEKVEGGFESIGHFSHCYYNELDLGQCDHISPSPSGRYAIYQQASSGLVMFFDARTGRSVEITPSFPGLLGPAIWQETSKEVAFEAGEPGKEQAVTFAFGAIVDGT